MIFQSRLIILLFLFCNVGQQKEEQEEASRVDNEVKRLAVGVDL